MVPHRLYAATLPCLRVTPLVNVCRHPSRVLFYLPPRRRLYFTAFAAPGLPHAVQRAARCSCTFAAGCRSGSCGLIYHPDIAGYLPAWRITVLATLPICLYFPPPFPTPLYPLPPPLFVCLVVCISQNFTFPPAHYIYPPHCCHAMPYLYHIDITLSFVTLHIQSPPHTFTPCSVPFPLAQFEDTLHTICTYNLETFITLLWDRIGDPSLPSPHICLPHYLPLH